MVTVEDFSRIVASIYAAAVTPESWERAIHDIHHTLGAAHGALLTTEGPIRSFLSSTLPIEPGNSYVEYYHRLDYVLAAVEKGPVGVVRTGAELTDPRKHREFHEDWAQPAEGDDGLAVRLTGGPRPVCFVVGAPQRLERFDTAERVKLMSGLVVHLQQALCTQNKLAILDESRGDLVGVLDSIRHGVILVGARWQVIYLNSAAENILRSKDGVQIQCGRLSANSVDVEQQLHRALHAALGGGGSDVRSGQSFTCRRPSCKRPYVIHLLPLHRAESDETPGGPTAVVLITDPEREEQPTTALRQLYNFTNTESEIALRLTKGDNLKQISDELSISLWTVRTHLKHIFDKTDTHRQAELVQHLLSLVS